MPGLGEYLFGRKDRFKRVSRLTKDQQAGLSKYFQQGIETSPLYGAGSSFLQSLLSNEPGMFEQFAAPHMQQFQQQIVPGIAERFAGAGTGAGAQSSSALNQALAQAGSNLQNQLASQRGNMQMQGLGQALSYAQQPYSNLLGGLGINSFDNFYQPGNLGLMGEFVKGAGQGLTGGFGQGFGNMFGANMFGPQAGTPGA